MAYITRELSDGEELVALNRPSWWMIMPRTLLALAVAIVIGVVLTMANWFTAFAYWALFVPAVIVIWLIMIAGQVVRVLSTEIAVTSSRVMSKVGVFNIEVKTTPLDKVNNVNVVQTVFGRMFDYGDIEVTTATAEENDNHFVKQLARPKVFRDHVTAMQDLENE